MKNLRLSLLKSASSVNTVSQTENLVFIMGFYILLRVILNYK
jgi:hypothetical protein